LQRAPVGKIDNARVCCQNCQRARPTFITRFKDVPPTDHCYKYSAVYVVDGVRMVGFDNERGKGDHCHLDGVEVPYAFTGVDQLIEDFIAAVAARRTP
jgi:hypothetical protein